MRRTLLKSKIHRATVTQADLDYVGSVTIDQDLMRTANVVEHERIEIYNITNGNRFATYAIHGEAGSGVICINGAAAHLASPGDLVILATFAEYGEEEIATHCPLVIHVDEHNVASSPRLVTEADRHEC